MKKQLLGLLALAFVGTAAIGVANVQASATGETPSAFSTFAMTDGASIMVGATDENATEKNGMRWQITMDKTAYANLATSNYTDIKFGVLIAPADGYTLTEETVFGDEAIYDWAEKQADGSYVYSGSKTRIINVYTDTLNAPVEEGKNYVEFFGGIMNLKDDVTEDGANNLARNFQALGYVEYKDGETVKYVMVGDEDNVRSMAYVAQKAIADESEDKPAEEVKTWLSDYYVAKAPNVKWYIDHYKQLADGTYAQTPDEVSEHTGAVSAVASAQNSPKSYEGYSLNELKMDDWQGFVWADGSTHLKLYYEKNDLSVKYGDYYVSFVQNEFNADAMENKIVDGKLVTIMGDSILDNFNSGVGNVATARPELVISGLTAGGLYTLNLKLTSIGEKVFFVPFKAQGASGNDLYFVFNEGTEKTYSISNLVANENGQIVFGSWYGNGEIVWDVEIINDEATAIYNGYQVRYLKDNMQPAATTLVTTVNEQGKLVTTASGEQGYVNTRAKLVVYGLKPNAPYCIKVSVTSTMQVICYPSESTGKNQYAIVAANTTGSFTHQCKTNEKGEWTYEGIYAGKGTIVWDLEINEEINTTFDNGVTFGVVMTTAGTTQPLPTVNADKSMTIKGEVQTSTTYYIKGLQANKTYSVKIYVTLTAGTACTGKTSSAYAKNVIGWLRSDTGKKLDAGLDAETAAGITYLSATITTDANGCFEGTGWYISGNSSWTITNIEATAN